MLKHLAVKELTKAVNNMYYGIGTQKDLTKLILGYSIVADLIIVSKESTTSDLEHCTLFKQCLKRIYKRSINKGRGVKGVWVCPFVTLGEYSSLKLMVYNVDNIVKTKCKF